MWKYFKEIKYLRSLQKAKVYLTAYYFGNISSIIDVRLGYIWSLKILKFSKGN